MPVLLSIQKYLKLSLFFKEVTEEMKDTLNLPKDAINFNGNACSQIILQWFS